MKVEALIGILGYMLKEVEAEIAGDSLNDVQAMAEVDTLAETLSE